MYFLSDEGAEWREYILGKKLIWDYGNESGLSHLTY